MSLWWIFLSAHQPITTKITWNKELIRIFQKSCLGCHSAGGEAFSLETYEDARAWAKAIRDEVLERRMPPWPAAKGFGEFANDRSLTPFEIEMIVSWAEGGNPRGDPKDLPGSASVPPAPPIPAGRTLRVEKTRVLRQGARALGVKPLAPEAEPVEVRALRPDGSRETLVWVRSFQARYPLVYWFREPVPLPGGSRIEVRGAAGASAELILDP